MIKEHIECLHTVESYFHSLQFLIHTNLPLGLKDKYNKCLTLLKIDFKLINLQL